MLPSSMNDAPNLLNDDGSPSMATAFLMLHHAFRRDAARFAIALEQIAQGDTSKLAALQEEWQSFRGALHGHHQAEDNMLFPSLAAQHAFLAKVFERLHADHRSIDPLLEQGDQAFLELPNTERAARLIAELIELLEPHLAREEAEIVPLLRDVRALPAPASEDEADKYADGFAWSAHGVAQDVVDRVCASLSETINRDFRPPTLDSLRGVIECGGTYSWALRAPLCRTEHAVRSADWSALTPTSA